MLDSSSTQKSTRLASQSIFIVCGESLEFLKALQCALHTQSLSQISMEFCRHRSYFHIMMQKLTAEQQLDCQVRPYTMSVG